MLIPDFSENQSSGAPDWMPTPDFAGVKRQNGGAAFSRVSLGIDHLDHCFTRTRQAAQQHGYAFLGLYQYIMDGPITAQAQAFCQWVGSLAPNEIPIADIEEGSGDQSGRAKTWFDIVDSGLGLAAFPLAKRSWLYANEDFFNHHGLAPICASDRNTWVAAYGAIEPALGHTLWQSTDGKNGSQITSWAGAGKCDTSLFHGTLSQLAAVISREDDLPYTKEEILDLVKQGVAAELRAGIDARGITPAQGAEAAFDTRNALKVLAQEVAELKDLVKRALPDAQRTTGTP